MLPVGQVSTRGRGAFGGTGGCSTRHTLRGGASNVESHGVGLHHGSPTGCFQVSQYVTVSAGGRVAGRKSVPIV